MDAVASARRLFLTLLEAARDFRANRALHDSGAIDGDESDRRVDAVGEIADAAEKALRAAADRLVAALTRAEESAAAT